MKLHHTGIISNNIRDAIKHHKNIFCLKQVTSTVKDPVHRASAILLSDPREVFIELIAPLTDSPVLNILKKGINPPISLQSLYFLFYSALHIYAFKR